MREVEFKIRDHDNNPLETDEFLKNLVRTSIDHKKKNRALTFAFIVYNFESPQLAKVLEDNHYWDSINRIASSYLSIFYIHSDEESLNQKNIYFSPSDIGKVFNHLFMFKSKGGPSDIAIPVLQKFFDIKENFTVPSIIFFQIDDQTISDSIFVELEENEIEKSFIEIKETVSEVVNRLNDISEENYENGDEIFRELRIGLNTLNHKKVFKKITKRVSITDLKSIFGL